MFRRSDGGQKGELCKKQIEKACKSFFRCGVKKIEDLCNDRREKLLREWQNKKPEDLIPQFPFPISFKQGIEEITPPFELNEPETIEVYILEGQRAQKNKDTAMDIGPLNEGFTRWEFHAYLDVMEYSDNNLQWRGFKESIEEITYHELLHACGDIPKRGKHDGILRHNFIGITCVKNCLDENFSNSKRM